MLVDQLSGSGFESSSSHLNFRFRACSMFDWVLNTPLILLKLLSLSTICEEAYLEPSQAFGMDVSAGVDIYMYIYIYIYILDI